MTPARTLDVSGLPDYEISNRAPLFWGQVFLACIEGSVFLILIAMYFYARLSVDVWPPPGVAPLETLIPSLALIPLVLSAVGSYFASEGAKKNNVRLMVIGLVANLLLALVFLWMRYVAWVAFNFTWESDIHGSLVWTILFLHTYDVVADLVMTTVLIVALLIGKNDARVRLGVHVDSVVWYFLVLIWFPLYATIYLGGHVLRAQP